MQNVQLLRQRIWLSGHNLKKKKKAVFFDIQHRGKRPQVPVALRGAQVLL